MTNIQPKGQSGLITSAVVGDRNQRGWRQRGLAFWLLAAFTVLALVAGVAVASGLLGVRRDAANVVAIDVRTPAEFALGHVQGAVNLDVQDPEFKSRLADLDPNQHYLVYCGSGMRAGTAWAAMSEAGFRHVIYGGTVNDAAKLLNRPVVS